MDKTIQQMIYDRELLDTKEAAKFLGMTRTALDSSRRVGKTHPAYYIYGKSVYYKPGDLEKWVSERLKRVEARHA